MSLSYIIEKLLYVAYMFSVLIFKLNKKQSFIFLMICNVIMITYCLMNSENHKLWYIIASAIIAHAFHFSQFKKQK